MKLPIHFLEASVLYLFKIPQVCEAGNEGPRNGSQGGCEVSVDVEQQLDAHDAAREGDSQL